MTKTEGKRRYKAKINAIASKSLSGNITLAGNAMLGISLGTKNSEDMRLAASLEFMVVNFNRCAIVVADDVYRLTLQLRDNVAVESSRDEAIKTGKKWFSRNRELIEQYQSVYEMEIIYLSELTNKSRFNALKAQMETFALTSAGFGNEIEIFANSYMKRIFPGEGQKHNEIFEMRYRLARQYLIEECAYTAYLKDLGWNNLVYAGTITTFERLAAQHIENAPEQLLNLPVISMKFEKRGRVDMSYTPKVPVPGC